MARKLAMPLESNIDIDRQMFNDKFFPYLQTINKYEIYFGGSSAGKSYFIGEKLALQMTLMPGRNLVCLRRQKKDCIKSCWAFIYNGLKRFKLLPYWDIRTNPEHVMINRYNGNEILFEGLDDVEDVKSIQFTQKNEDSPLGANLTDVWYEEVNAEPSVDPIDELDRRLRDPYVKTRIILSFNPVSRSHWLFEYVTVRMKQPGVDALILHSTYKDNKFLKPDYGIMMERLKYTKPYEYMVYALGDWGILGQSVFDVEKIHQRMLALEARNVTAPPKRGYFAFTSDKNGLPTATGHKFIPDITGDLKIFIPPEDRTPYVISVDTAGEGSDYWAAHVRDNITQEQVAVFHSKLKPDPCIGQIYCLAMYYNRALVCFESNFDTWPIKAFLMLGYTDLYRRVSPADKTHIRREDRYGFRTTSENRQTIINEFISWSDSYMHMINDEDTLSEMLTFTRQEKKLKGIWMGAESGAHDDLVMAFAILLQAASQQSMQRIAAKKKLEGKWNREELEEAIDSGRIDRTVAKEYVESNGYYDEPSTDYSRKRVSKYAR